MSQDEKPSQPGRFLLPNFYKAMRRRERATNVMYAPLKSSTTAALVLRDEDEPVVGRTPEDFTNFKPREALTEGDATTNV